MSSRHWLWLWLSIGSLLCAALFLAVEPIAQPLSYHAFVDQRPLLGVSNAANVLSNLGFVFSGLFGLWACTRCHAHSAQEQRAWRWLFIAVLATAFGSGYYHLAPDNARLVWDRLPMAVGFMALCNALAAERLQAKWIGRWLLPLMLLGAASVLWWAWSETRGAGDLRPYLLIQLLPFAAMLGLLLGRRAPYSHTLGYWLALLGYLLAKVAEFSDAALYRITAGGLSGHSAKHLLAALGIAALAWMLARRQPR